MNLETHLAALPEDEARAFREVVRLLRARPEAEPSPGLCERILAQLPARREAGSCWRWGAPIAASLAALLGLAALLQHRGAPKGGGGEEARWLAENQDADGTWSPARHGGAEAFRPALTALSVLALRQAEPYARQAARGVSALERLQTAEGAFGGDGGQAQLYNLALATYTLAACGAVGPVVPRAVGRIRACQQPDGSWGYSKTHEGSAAVTAWMTRALERAEAGGIAEAGVPLRKGLRWLRDHVRDDGRMAYRPAAAPSETLTALSAHSLLEAGRMFPDLQALGLRMAGALRALPPDGGATADRYRDYAKIIAFESAGDAASAERVRGRLRPSADADDQWRAAGGQVYAAALATLSRAR